MGFFLRQFLGVFGWLDTPSPFLSTALWSSLLGFLVVLGLAASRRRHSVVLVLLLLGSLVLTAALIEFSSHTLGITWQARDGFPLYAGVPLVAGFALPRDLLQRFGQPARRRMAFLVAVAVGVSLLADLLWSLRRFTVGLGNTVNPFHHVRHGWSPPLGTWFALVLAAVAVVLYASCLFWRMTGNDIPEVALMAGNRP